MIRKHPHESKNIVFRRLPVVSSDCISEASVKAADQYSSYQLEEFMQELFGLPVIQQPREKLTIEVLNC